MTNFCSNCGQAQSAGANFCPNCGHKHINNNDEAQGLTEEGKPSANQAEGNETNRENVQLTTEVAKSDTTQKATIAESQMQTHNKEEDDEEREVSLKALWIGTIFFLVGIISHCIGMYGMSTFRRELKNSYQDDINASIDCMDSAASVIRRTNLPIGGLAVVFVFELIWLFYWWCMACPKKPDDDWQGGILGCGGCYLISHILSTASLSYFMFGDEMAKYQRECGDDSELYGIWKEYDSFVYYSWGWILFTWLMLGCGFCKVWCKMFWM